MGNQFVMTQELDTPSEKEQHRQLRLHQRRSRYYRYNYFPVLPAKRRSKRHLKSLDIFLKAHPNSANQQPP